MGTPQLSGITNLPLPSGVPVTNFVGLLDPLASSYYGTEGNNEFVPTGHTTYTTNPTVVETIRQTIR